MARVDRFGGDSAVRSIDDVASTCVETTSLASIDLCHFDECSKGADLRPDLCCGDINNQDVRDPQQRSVLQPYSLCTYQNDAYFEGL